MRTIAVALLIFLSSCFSPILNDEDENRPTGETFTLPVQTIYDYAEMASVVYETESEINDFFASKPYDQVITAVLPTANVRYILLKNNTEALQVIVIRGTENQENAITDINSVPYFESGIGWLHRGFRDASYELFLALEKSAGIKKNYRTTIVGHSLGGAMSAILGVFMLEAGYTINQVVTFGQPKFTDEEGADRYNVMPLIRIVGAGDTVASVPPSISDIKYVHTGLKVSLNDSSLSHANVGDSSNRTDDTGATDLSGVLNHRMTVYLSRLSPHVGESLTIVFKNEFYWVSRL